MWAGIRNTGQSRDPAMTQTPLTNRTPIGLGICRPRHGRGGDGAGRGGPSGLRAAGRRRPASGPARGLRPRPQRARLCRRAELAADPAVEVVYIATPHQFHAPHAILAAEHGKHIILEKPMALTLADCDAIIAAVERNKVHLIVGHTHAFDPAVRLMRDIIARRRAGPARADPQLQLHQLSLPSAPAGGARHLEGRRHPVQPGAAPDRHRAAARRRHGPQRARARPTCSIRRGRPRRAASRSCNSRTASRRRWSTAATTISIPTNGTSASASAARRSRSSHGAARRALAKAAKEEAGRAPRPTPTARASRDLPPHQPHFGVTIVTCADGDMRAVGRRRLDLRPRRHARNPDAARRQHAGPARGARRHALRRSAPATSRCTTAAGARPPSRSRSRSCARRARAARSRWNIRWRWTILRIDIEKARNPAPRPAGARHARSSQRKRPFQRPTATAVSSSRTSRT